MNNIILGTQVYTSACLFHPNRSATDILYRQSTYFTNPVLNPGGCVMHVCNSHWQYLKTIPWYVYIGELGL